MVETSRKYKILIILILFLSISLRFGLVLYNRQSNDNHDQVISLILTNRNLPSKKDCSECFQPKFFHYTAAKVLQMTGLDKANPTISLALAVELINFAAGVLTVLVIGVFITCLPVKSETLKLFSFGLVALNPKLIGINSQGTNDTFAILFSTLALYCTVLFLQKQKLGTFLLTVLFTLLGIASKTNVWVTAIAITLLLFIKAWEQRKHSAGLGLIGLLFIVSTIALSILNPLNQYISNYQNYGSPFLLNTVTKPLPHFFAKTSVHRTGILSIQDGFLTFKFINLLQHPRIENDKNGNVFPAHMTSLWTQLYGRAYSVHFDNHPSTWSTTGEQGFALTRAIYILALLPTFLLLLGAALEIVVLLMSIFKRDEVLASTVYYGLATVTFIGYILFIIVYSLLYRDFSVMKVIFIYPALITFPMFFLRAGEFLNSHLIARLRWLRMVFVVWIVTLFILYSADILTMIQLIYSRRV